ncbi:class I SAM-dependent methyltransferase [candidate division WOR-3 bacterium]|nr:class I SAM-dependent methyltransferase [candidate division WOR-3 bacterium]
MEWWKKLFDKPYSRIFLESKKEKVLEEVNFIEEVLLLSKNAKILDLCCGLGRHSIELAKRGYNVTGVDFSKEYLEIAQKKAKKKGVTVNFIKNDMRKISFNQEFDAVINMFTSFGYFRKEEDNLKVLKNVAKALKPGGKFLIDIVNKDWIIKNFEERDWQKIGEYYVFEERKFDLATSINYAKFTIIHGKERIERESWLRMYSFHELKSMLENAGLKIIESYENLEKEELTFDSRMMEIVSQKNNE